MGNIHKDLGAIKLVATAYATEHKCNYNIILMHPDENGNFSEKNGSTYEFVQDSYFEKDRPFVKLITTTDEIIALENNNNKL